MSTSTATTKDDKQIAKARYVPPSSLYTTSIIRKMTELSGASNLDQKT